MKKKPILSNVVYLAVYNDNVCERAITHYCYVSKVTKEILSDAVNSEISNRGW